MLMSASRGNGPPQGAPQPEPDVELSFDRLAAIARRQFVVVALACAVGVGCGVVYLLTTVPLYTARAHMLVDTRAVRAVEEVSGVTSLGSDDMAVQSEVEVIRSEQIGMRVVERLKLHEDEMFLNPPTGNFFSAGLSLLRRVADPLGWFAPEDDIVSRKEDPKRRALGRLQHNLDVRRHGRTYVLQVAYTSPDPSAAARLANAVANAYITDQLDTRYDSTRRAGDWLRERIAELQRQTRDADLAVQRFRADNNLIETDGRLVSEQQLSEISSQLILARAETAGARARYQRIKAIMDAGRTDAVVREALEQDVFSNLRASYLDAARRAASLSDRLGAEHVQVVSLRNEMREYERLAFEELGRIKEGYFSDYEVARSREDALQEGLERALGVTAVANETLVELRQLESRTATYRALLDNLQRRFEEAMQQQSFPISQARIITAASPPSFPSHPGKSTVLALSLMLGGVFGAAIGLVREHSDRVFRTGEQVRDELQVEFLGMLPRIDDADTRVGYGGAAALLAEGRFAAPGITRHALDKPLSGFAETLRAAKVAADIALQDGSSRIIGVVSTMPGEGKSTAAMNFAALLAQQGKRTLLIDADMRNPGLTRSAAPLAERGLIDNLLHEVPLDDLLLEEVDCALHFLPCVITTRISHTADLMASPAMRGLLREAARTHDYVVLDCPPLNPVVDVRAAANIFDGFIYVVEWGRTPRAAVRNTLDTEREVHDRCLGVVLSMVDARRLAPYEDYNAVSHEDPRYASYYQA